MMLDCFGFDLLRCVIGPENVCHNLNQSTKTKHNLVTRVFPHLRRLPVSTLGSHWLMMTVTFCSDCNF